MCIQKYHNTFDFQKRSAILGKANTLSSLPTAQLESVLYSTKTDVAIVFPWAFSPTPSVHHVVGKHSSNRQINKLSSGVQSSTGSSEYDLQPHTVTVPSIGGAVFDFMRLYRSSMLFLSC